MCRPRAKNPGDNMPAMRVKDYIVLSMVRYWCFIRYPRVSHRTFRRSGVAPNPARPVTDVDKFLWRKIFDHNPLFTMACDKLAAKNYALSKCPGLKTAKVLWSGDDPTMIPADLLSGSVVVKANHGSNWNVMVHNGEYDRAALRERASDWVGRQYGRSFGEWGYKNARRCLFVEGMLVEDGEPARTEYNFHVSGGQVGHVYVTRRREQGGNQWCCFDRDGRVFLEPADRNDRWVELDPPATFDRMRDSAETLAAPFDHMRCDFYELDGEIYFSELTTYPQSGKGLNDLRLVALLNANWDLRKSWFLTTRQTGWRKMYGVALRKWLDDGRLA
jgi:hypothetical protein